MHTIKATEHIILKICMLALIVFATTPSHTGTMPSRHTESEQTQTTDTEASNQTNTITASVKTILKTGWTAIRLVGVAGCFKLAHTHRYEAFIGNIAKDYTYADYLPFGTCLTVAGMIAHNIYKDYEASIKKFFEEEEEEENQEADNDKIDSEQK